MGFTIDDLTAMTFITEGIERGIKRSPRDIEESEDISVLRRAFYSQYGCILAKTGVVKNGKSCYRVYTYKDGVYYKGELLRVFISTYNLGKEGQIVNKFTPKYRLIEGLSKSLCVIKCKMGEKTIGRLMYLINEDITSTRIYTVSGGSVYLKGCSGLVKSSLANGRFLDKIIVG